MSDELTIEARRAYVNESRPQIEARRAYVNESRPQIGARWAGEFRGLLDGQEVYGEGQHDLGSGHEAAYADGLIGAVGPAKHRIVVRIGA